jgi:hypothetical protein
VCFAPVGPRNRFDDRESKPGTSALTSAILATEAFECVFDEVGPEAGTLVGYVELDARIRADTADPNRTPSMP